MLCPLANNSIACSTSTCADSTMMATSGNSSRITRAASSPSVVWVGGMRISTHTNASLPHHFESRAVQQAGQTLPKQQIVVGHHHAHASHHLLTSPELVFLRTWRATYAP